jgi:hypothetical protein
VTTGNVIAFLDRFIAGEFNADVLEEWANLV